MNKTQLIERIAEEAGLSKAHAKDAVDSVLEAIMSTLSSDGTVAITGFGKFVTRNQAEREARNPLSGEMMAIPAKRVPTFKAGATLKKVVNVEADPKEA